MSKFFLYNGVKLPALPEWDKTVYPYAFIYIVTLDGTTGVYTLVASSSSVMGYDGNGIICPAATVGQRYTVSEDSWAAAADSDDFYIKRDNLIYTVWANFDVLNSDGSVYVAASEPVPVAGKFPLREWVGWRVIGLCSRPLPMRAREPVAWLYNGVRLPGLPEEWNPETHPFAMVTYRGNVGYYFSVYASQNYYTSEDSNGWYYFGVKDGFPDSMIWDFWNEYEGWNSDTWVFGDRDGASIRVDKTAMTDIAIWTNFDLHYADGAIYIAASDPIPVYE